MTARDFAFWLQGFLEIGRAESNQAAQTRTLNESQVACIERHLAMVFVHEIDPSFGDTNAALNTIHNPPALGGTTPEGVLIRC